MLTGGLMGSAHASTVLDADRTGGLMDSAHAPTVSAIA